MALSRRGSFRLKRTVSFAAAAAVLVLPGNAFACWDLCLQTFGAVKVMYGSYWELDHCVQWWPDGARDPSTKCYYSRIYAT